jgi:hypothetical protein
VATATNYSREVGVLLVLSLVNKQLVEHKDFVENHGFDIGVDEDLGDAKELRRNCAGSYSQRDTRSPGRG